MLFQVDLSAAPVEEVFGVFWEGQTVPSEVRDFAERLVRGVQREQALLDRWIGEASEHWKIERMAVVDRNVLRIAAYELLFERETPAAVVLNEAIEIAKKYGSAESASFINGVLDAIRRRAAGDRAEPPPRAEPR